jgi:hypothetical protein
MIFALQNQGLVGLIEDSFNYQWSSYIVRVYKESDTSKPLYVMSFGNSVTAENKLLELMEHPAWTLLRFG